MAMSPPGAPPRPPWADDMPERLLFCIPQPHIRDQLPHIPDQYLPKGLFLGTMYGYELVNGSQYPLSTHTTIDLYARLTDDHRLWIFEWTVRGTTIDDVLAQTPEYNRYRPLPHFQPIARVSGIWSHIETYRYFEELRLRDGKYWYSPSPMYGLLPSGHRFFHGPWRNNSNGARDLEPRLLWKLKEVEVYRALLQCGGNIDAVPRLSLQAALRWMDTLD